MEKKELTAFCEWEILIRNEMKLTGCWGLKGFIIATDSVSIREYKESITIVH